MVRSLNAATGDADIKVNAIAPAAVTRMGGGDDGPPPANMDPALVAPMAAYLAHESCPVSGEVFAAGSGRFTKVFIAETEGYIHPDLSPTIEDVAAHWAEITDESNYWVPPNLMGWAKHFNAHLS